MSFPLLFLPLIPNIFTIISENCLKVRAGCLTILQVVKKESMVQTVTVFVCVTMMLNVMLPLACASVLRALLGQHVVKDVQIIDMVSTVLR